MAETKKRTKKTSTKKTASRRTKSAVKKTKTASMAGGRIEGESKAKAKTKAKTKTKTKKKAASKTEAKDEAESGVATKAKPTRRKRSVVAKVTPSKVAPSQIAKEEDDAPRIDAPRIDAPKNDAPKNDAPKNDAPKNDAPKTAGPQIFEPREHESSDAFLRTPTPDSGRDFGFGEGILDYSAPPRVSPPPPPFSETTDSTGETERPAPSPARESQDDRPDLVEPRRKSRTGRRGRRSKKPAQVAEPVEGKVDEEPGLASKAPGEDREKTSRKPRRRRRGGRSRKADGERDVDAAGKPPVSESIEPSLSERGFGFAEGLDFESRDELPANEPVAGVATPPTDSAARRVEHGRNDRGRNERGHGDRGGSERKRDEEKTTEIKSEPPTKAKVDSDKREMLINVSDSDECRIAMLCDGRLEELYIERATSASNVGNIYKGRVTNVESSIQAAFVDFGLSLHGFLHISDLHPKYFPESKGEPELVGKKTPRRHRPPIQHCLRRGDEIIVQVIKEGIGTKGPTLSSYISLPGRFLVMMPGMEQLGVSRKIEDEEQRRKLRDSLAQLALPKDMGFIVRTAGVDRTKRDLQRDLNYLSRLWKKVAVRIKSEPAPATLYKESDLVIRTIRDVYDASLSKIIVDSKPVAGRVKEFLSIASPRTQDVVELYDRREPMFHRFGIESEIDKLHSHHVSLPCGGSLVIESTEALVAIDVNSGRFRIPENAEETAYRVNLEAVDEIARQLRLRDLGGLVICDLIDMSFDRHRRAVEKRLLDALKKHKERAEILRISRFGILEMTRQRQRPSFAKGIYQDCQRCGGSGRVKTAESASLDVMRQIRLASHREGVICVDVNVAPLVANDLLNRKRGQLTDLERATSQTIRVHARPDLNIEAVQISCTDRRGREVPQDGDNETSQGDGARRPGDAPRRTGDAGGDRPRDDRPDQRSGSSDPKGGRRRRGGRRRGK